MVSYSTSLHMRTCHYQELTWSRISTGSLHFSPHTVRQEGHITAAGEERMGGAGVSGDGRGKG